MTTREIWTIEDVLKGFGFDGLFDADKHTRELCIVADGK